MSSLAGPESSRMTLKMTFPDLKAFSRQINWGKSSVSEVTCPSSWCSESVVLPGYLDIDNPTAKQGKQVWLLLSSTPGGGQGSSAGTDCRCPSCGHHWPAASFHPPPAPESFPCLRRQMGTYVPNILQTTPHSPRWSSGHPGDCKQTWEGAVDHRSEDGEDASGPAPL